MNNRHLIVVSVDALVYEDIESAKGLPMFEKILREGSQIERVTTIYPSSTHPVHASMMTGCPAGVTGVIANEIFEAGKSPRPWYNELSQVNCDTIFHAAKRAGLTTCACRWPLTACGGDVIDYLVPEVMGTDMAGHEENPIEVYRTLGCGENVMGIVEHALERYGSALTHPTYDEFEIYCAAEIIKKYQPNLLFCHPSYVDSARHRTGLFSDAVKESVRVTDGWLQTLWEAVCEAGIEEQTDFVVVSDHGHLPVTRVVKPNVFFADQGLIRTDEDGNLKEWDAYVAGGGLSGLVYLARPEDQELADQVYHLLQKMASEQIYGFESVFTKAEVKEKYGLDGAFSFVLETDGYSAIGEGWTRPAVQVIKREDVRHGAASHGHLPEKGPQPTFMAMGPSFRTGVTIPEGHILDHAPTFARILGVQLKDAQGKAMEELLAL